MSSWVAACLPLVILLAVIWLTYWDTLKAGWVSDDCVQAPAEAKAIAFYEGQLQRPISWGTCFKKLRWLYGRNPNPNRQWQKDKQSAYINLPRAHHRFNLVIFSGTILFFYSFLCRLFNPTLAFLASLLFIVHPLGAQTVAWVSGINYLVAMFFMLLGLNVNFFLQDLGWMTTPLGVLGVLLLYGLCQLASVEAMFCTIAVIGITVWLHWWPQTIIAALLAIVQGLHTFREAILLRKKIFHEQQMDSSVRFHYRKLIIVAKTLAYNARLALWPKRLGLYHIFNYHYELPYVEHEDSHMLLGLLIGFGGLAAICYGPPPLQLGSLWFLSFIAIFLNWITANQFVVDRYVWLPSAGICLMVSWFCSTYHLMPLYWVLIGIAMMRTWSHLPTYDNEEKFYLSNIWNFPSSEVAYGNLGVAYLNQGLIGMAMDCWWRGTQLNPEYDVCWYNLSSLFRTRGPLNPNFAPLFFSSLPRELQELALMRDPNRSHLHIGRYCLEKAVQAKNSHFPEPWKKELEGLVAELGQHPKIPSVQLIHPLFVAALT